MSLEAPLESLFDSGRKGAVCRFGAYAIQHVVDLIEDPGALVGDGFGSGQSIMGMNGVGGLEDIAGLLKHHGE